MKKIKVILPSLWQAIVLVMLLGAMILVVIPAIWIVGLNDDLRR